MYGVFTYIWVVLGVNVGKYTIHGCYGIPSQQINQNFRRKRHFTTRETLSTLLGRIASHKCIFEEEHPNFRNLLGLTKLVYRQLWTVTPAFGGYPLWSMVI